MATVTRENIGTLHDNITVKLEKSDYMPAFEKSLKNYAKTATIPGFRKGMVPAGMLRKMYGQSLLNDEVVRTASRQLEDYMKGEKMAIFAQPMLVKGPETRIDIMSPVDAEFSFEIGLKPEFDVESVIAANALTHYSIAVSDKMLADEKERISRRYGKVDEQTEITAADNIIYSTIEACDANGNVAEGAQKIEDTEEFGKMPAKMQEMLMGKAPGYSVVFVPSEVCTEEELAGFMKDPLKADVSAAGNSYKLTLTKVGHLIPASIDAELFERVFPNKDITTEEAFTNRLREEIQFELTRITNERLQNEMFELLVHKTDITLPVPFLKRWLREGGEKPKTEEEVEAEFGSFEHQLRWQLISDKLMMENGIQITMNEVRDDIKGRVLAYFGMGADEAQDAPWIESYLDKVTKDEKMVDETYRRLLFGKLFAFLATKFAVTAQEVSEEEFFKLADPHATHHHHAH